MLIGLLFSCIMAHCIIHGANCIKSYEEVLSQMDRFPLYVTIFDPNSLKESDLLQWSFLDSPFICKLEHAFTHERGFLVVTEDPELPLLQSVDLSLLEVENIWIIFTQLFYSLKDIYVNSLKVRSIGITDIHVKSMMPFVQVKLGISVFLNNIVQDFNRFESLEYEQSSFSIADPSSFSSEASLVWSLGILFYYLFEQGFPTITGGVASLVFRKTDIQASKLISSMLQLDPNSRPTLAEISSHPNVDRVYQDLFVPSSDELSLEVRLFRHLFNCNKELHSILWQKFKMSVPIIDWTMVSKLKKLNLYGHGELFSLKGFQVFLNLQELDISLTSVNDLEPLRDCTSLKILLLKSTNVVDISPLSYCHLLQKLSLNSSLVTDVSPLSSCVLLETLDIASTQVRDISSLSHCLRLQNLYASWSLVASIHPLQYCKQLVTIDLHKTNLSDISFLSWCKLLKVLNMTFCMHLSSIGALSNCRKLEILSLTSTNVIDLSPLSNCHNLKKLYLNSTNVSHIEPLSNCCNLVVLHLSNTLVEDISPLCYCTKLRCLEIEQTTVKDTSVLGPLVRIFK
ncbi:hypothetical protein RCL1_000088 [Eukaryota sp. TZLM3-RCL]